MKQIILQDLLASVSILLCGQRIIASYNFPNHTDASNSRPCHNGASFLHLQGLMGSVRLLVSKGEYRVVVRSIRSTVSHPYGRTSGQQGIFDHWPITIV